jgi:hypothetical protein
MNVHVDAGRFLSVASDPEERIVFDRRTNRYHLLRDSAARLWDEIGEGGTFDVETADDARETDPVAQLREAGIVEIADADAKGDRISRRSWMRRTGTFAAAAIALPLVATVTSPRLVLGQDDSGTPGTDCSLFNLESSGFNDSSGDGESSGDESGESCESGDS